MVLHLISGYPVITMERALIGIVVLAGVIVTGAWQVEHSLVSLPDNAHWDHLGPFPLALLVIGSLAIFYAGLAVISGVIFRSRRLTVAALDAAFSVVFGGALAWGAVSLKLNHHPDVAQVVYAGGLAIYVAAWVFLSRMRRHNS